MTCKIQKEFDEMLSQVEFDEAMRSAAEARQPQQFRNDLLKEFMDRYRELRKRVSIDPEINYWIAQDGTKAIQTTKELWDQIQDQGAAE